MAEQQDAEIAELDEFITVKALPAVYAAWYLLKKRLIKAIRRDSRKFKSPIILREFVFRTIQEHLIQLGGPLNLVAIEAARLAAAQFGRAVSATKQEYPYSPQADEILSTRRHNALLSATLLVLTKVDRTLKQPRSGSFGAQLVKAVELHVEAVNSRVQVITKTEANYVWNAAIVDYAGAVAPEGYLRWTELVDDFSGLPLDARVGKDSLHMHGQVARPGELFRSDVIVPGAWLHPPNRPNDRAVLKPWTRSTGLPAWRSDGSQP